MSVTTTSNYDVKLSWTQNDRSESIVVNDNSSIRLQDNMASGTGIGQVNTIWYQTIELNSGENRNFDLMALPKIVLGTSGNINFSGGYIKQFLVVNSATGSGQGAWLDFSGTNAFNPHVLNQNITHNIPRNSYYGFDNRDGYQVTATDREFKIRDHGYAADIQVVVIGSV
jgi:hypothetical protein